jgi:hypothetical protein
MLLEKSSLTTTTIHYLEYKISRNNSNVMQVVSSTNSGEGSQTMNMKKKKLAEAILLRNKCQARNHM